MDRTGRTGTDRLSPIPLPPTDPGLVRAATDLLLPRCRFPAPGSAVICGVSGGADSLAMLTLAVAAGCQATAVHVDHGLRPDSAHESEAVAAVAERLGASFRSEQVDVGAGPNVEARARTARHEVLGPDALFGHTADDQAETMLLNLVRGAGVDGLAGIRADRRHPILALRRHETHALCAQLGLTVVEDPSNQDPAIRRNRVRAEVMPLLDDVAERDVVSVLARQAERFREVAELLDRLAADLDPTDAAALTAAPAALARVAVREWLKPMSPERHPPDAATIERVLAVARLEAKGTDVGGGWRVGRREGRLRLVPPG